MKKGGNPKKTTDAKNQISKQAQEENKQRMEQVNKFESYIQDSGLTMAFQLIFSELISKQVNPENYFSYVTLRLREIGKEIDSLKTFPPVEPKEDINEGEEMEEN